jgi:biotin carboxyl carrier protein
MKKLRITVEGRAYEVLVETLDEAAPALPAAYVPPAAPAPAPVAAPAPSAAAAPAASGPGDVPSPLAGKVVSIDVALGQSVASGAQVATVEAMKMNTFIYAPKAGTVAAVLVAPGDGVEEGSVIMRLS